jgi:hypothetical protein
MKINYNMLEISIIWKPLDNHIQFEWNFKILMKIMKVHVGMVAIPPMWWPPHQFQHLHHVEFDVKFISSRKLLKLHEKLVEILPIWWPLDGFCFLAC